MTHHPPFSASASCIFSAASDSASSTSSPTPPLMLTSKAPRACGACRKQKRRCTKELPQCSLCVRNGRPCEYDKGSQTHAAVAPRSPLATPTSSSGEPSSSTKTLDNEHSDISRLAALYFLDYEFYRQTAETCVRSNVALPAEVMSHLPTQSQQLRSIADVYFSTVNTHLPIISKLRLYRELSGSQKALGADMALLLITMKLHASPGPSNNSDKTTGGPLYASAITGLSFLETSGSQALSISAVQAALLLSLYELEHTIYPSAYLRVGHCARLAQSIGLHDTLRAPQMLGERRELVHYRPQHGMVLTSGFAAASSGIEEGRRVWWAIRTLRSYLNIGGPGRALACHETILDPNHHEYMPMKEIHWDQGIHQEPSLFNGSLINMAQTNTSPLGRTYQATYLLCRVFHHVNHRGKPGEDAAGIAAEIHQSIQDVLARVLQEADLLVEQTGDATAHLALAPSAGLLFSALFSLFDYYSCPSNFTPAEGEAAEVRDMQDLVRSGVRALPRRVAAFAERIEAAANLGGAPRVSPLVCDALYQAAANCIWYADKTPGLEDEAVVSTLRRVLTLLGGEWNLPVVYDRMLEQAMNSLWLEEGEQLMDSAD